MHTTKASAVPKWAVASEGMLLRMNSWYAELPLQSPLVLVGEDRESTEAR